MLCLRCYGAVPNPSKNVTQKGLRAMPSRPNLTPPTTYQSSRLLTTTTPAAARSISTQSALLSSAWRSTSRPSISASTFPSPSLSPAPTTSAATPFQQPSSTTRSFSASAFLGAKRDTYNPSRRVQKRRHGYLARVRSRGGRKVLMRRRAKGRKFLSW